MDELIFRILKGRASPDEVARCDHWRHQSPENEQRFQQVARLLDTAGSLPEPATPDPHPLPDPARLRREADRRTFARRRLQVARRVAGLVAASLVLVAGGVATSRLFRPGPRLSFQADEFVTGPLDMATIRLSDGSVVRLGPRSQLQLTHRDARTVTLRGRAYFAVAHLDGHPFKVRTDAGDALVLGTRFDILADSGQVRVVVVEGTVALALSGDTVRVVAGQMSRVIDGHTTPAAPVPDVTEQVRWTGKLLVFQDTPLVRALADIQREYGVRVDLVDRRLGTETVTAWFQDRNFVEVMRVICGVLNARCSIAADGAEIGTQAGQPAGSQSFNSL